MPEISIKEYKNTILKWDYVYYAGLLNNIQKHILRTFDNSIITLPERNIYFKNLNDITRLIKAEYDEYKNYLNELDNTKIKYDFAKKLKLPQKKMIHNKKNRIDLKYLVYLSKMKKIKDNGEIKKIYSDRPFKKVYDDIQELCSKIGFYSLHDALSSIVGEYYENLYDDKTLNIINDMSEVFIPIGFSIVDNANTDTNALFSINKVDCETPALLDNFIEFKLKDLSFDNCSDDRSIVFTGYINFDNLNIINRTSTLCYTFFNKKLQEKEEVLEKEGLNERFSKQYMKCCPLYDIIGLDDKQFLQKIKKDYSKYREVIKYNYIHNIKNFTRCDNLTQMFEIIKFLLMGGSTANIKGANLAFQISKEDKKLERKESASVLYRNLSHYHQNKLRRSQQTIQEELKEIKKLSIDDIDLKSQVSMCANMPQLVKRVALEKIEEMKSSNNEYYKQLLYVKNLLGFPWPSDEDNNFFKNMSTSDKESSEFLNGVMEKLNEYVYGHKECKEEIQRMVAKWISNPSSAGNAIGLEGPPGVGKTLLANGLGKALGIPCVKIHLGGQNDGEILIGHGYTYSGAQPGMIVKKMVESGAPRCILYFDELDKACQKHGSNEIFNILIHLTDPNMNEEFQDRFFQEVSFPLNKVIFVFSYNDRELIDRILLDRLKKLHVKPYSLTDKINIAKKFLLKECHNEYSYELNSIKMSDKVLKFLIEGYIREAGVRELKRKIENIFGKINYDKYMKNGIFKKKKTKLSAKYAINITEKIIQSYLGPPIEDDDKIHEYDAIGIVNGLYATSIGTGGIVPIQIVNNKTGTRDKFNFILTGSQGKVMKESIHVACSIALEYVSDKMRKKFFAKHNYGFHIHTPSGATPKDGPSAGCAFATAFVSRILNKKIRKDVGMTGEIDLMARVTKIGGLIYKITGARKAGIKKVLVSIENKKDVEDIKKDHKELIEGDFEIKYVKVLADVLKEIIIDFKEDDIIHGDFVLDKNMAPDASFEE